MSNKINLETAKKLFSVKKGGAEFFRLIIKIAVWIFILGAIISVIYSLDEIRKTSQIRTNIAIAKAQMEVIKVQRQCEAGVRANLASALQKAKNEKKEIKKEDQEKFLNSGFNECLFLNGMNIQTPKTEKTADKKTN